MYGAVCLARTSQIMTGKGVPPIADEEPISVSLLEPNEVLADGFLVPVVISDIVYPPLQATPAATARLLTCRASAKRWVVSGGAVPADLIGAAWKSIERARTAVAAVAGDTDMAALVRFFRILLHSYASTATPPAAPGELHDLASREQLEAWAAMLQAGTQWERTITEAFDSTAVCRVRDEAGGEDAPAGTKAGAQVVFSALVTEVAGAAQLLADAARAFAGANVLKKQMALWQVMRNAQRASI